ncbi:ImmA/IrrE family metallo-endopeptidase [Pelagibius sp. CAU 1746]|uniref:ImmA/IrrE family metallo-endopeptidase n=1 Tax=Pelagibius sp. CAU 1746 TaxID=3140370 RepID=UPI00325B6815
MSREQIPVTARLITWARERAGISIEEASKTFKKIEAWEDIENDIFPTYVQLEQLSERFKVPIAVFFFPEPPAVPPIRESFRTLPDQQFDGIPSQVRLLLRKAKALQLNLVELNQGTNPADRLISHDLGFPTNVEVTEMAEQVRAYLGVSLEQQCAWQDDDTALANWRDTLGEVGISVFKDAFRVPEYSGFCLYDDVFPVIYANNSVAKTRQIFTLFHELAHLLFHTSGIDTFEDSYIPDLANDARRIEILCNRFSAQFLIPDEAFENTLQGKPASEETAAEIAAHFHVSREVVFRKFLDRGLIEQAAYTEAATEWAAQRGGGGGGNWYNTKIAYLGRDYIGLAFKQFHSNRIDETQLAEYLDTKPRNLAVLEEYFARGSV